MKDFFISYNKADRDWAVWLAPQLKNAGYSTVIQVEDMPPGSNFVLEMQIHRPRDEDRAHPFKRFRAHAD